jgi:flavin reductase (DIM6/NTAB) family NADH-FMN oxidoreductase RutF
MNRIDIPSWTTRPFRILDQEWALLVSGIAKPNPMTVSWGGFGTLWHKPVVTVYVRPTRHTYTLLNESNEFTLNFLGENYREAMDLCGRKSGREIDKWKATGLRPEAGTLSVPRISEAHLSIDGRVLAHQDFDPAKFVDPGIEGNYPAKDYHRIYWGEVVALWGREGA